MKSPAPQLALWIHDEIAAEKWLKAIAIAGADQDGDKIADPLRSMKPESRYLGKAAWRGKAQYGVSQEFSFPGGLNTVTDGELDPQIRIEIPTEWPVSFLPGGGGVGRLPGGRTRGSTIK